MKNYSRIFAGTALGLVMAASPVSAASLYPAADGNSGSTVQAPLLMAQGDTDNTRKPSAEKKKGDQGEKRARQAQREEKSAEKPEKPRHERQNSAQGQSEEGGKAQRSAQKAPANDEAPAMKPNRKNRQAGEAGGQAEQGGDSDQPAASKSKHRDQGEARQPAAEQQAPERAQAEDQGKKHRRNAKHGEDNGQAVEGKTEQPMAGKKAVKQPQDAGKAPTGEKKLGETQQNRKYGKNAKGEEAGKGQAGETEAGQTAPKPGERLKLRQENAGKTGDKMQPEQADRNNERSKNGDRRQNAQERENGGVGKNDEESQGTRRQANQGGQGAEGGGNVVLPKSLNGERAGEGKKRERRNAEEQNGKAGNGALPDSARGRHGKRQEAGRGGKGGPLPDSDAAAQADFERPERIESITAVEGRRVDRPERVYREHPRDVKVVKEVDNRTIVEVNNQIFVRGSDRPRISHDARDVYYEDLPHSRTREVIERRDGSRIVTIRNEYGDVIRRSRIMPDNREVVLVYVDDRDLDRDRDYGWGDVGADLPPLVVDVPQDDYILEADNVEDPDRYYAFLEQPPVEPVQRLYSLGEVKRSARIRDIMPRIDLDTITFEFGSSEVGQDQADKLQSVADAIKRILDDNPAETFLIEGHTDAVGSDQANLVLSDERADSVASLLTSMFEIPSENLTTQGYGEQYLKVDTEEANRQNRRVTIRRITPLVAPVASAQ